jgi:hypothetical protein
LKPFGVIIVEAQRERIDVAKGMEIATQRAWLVHGPLPFRRAFDILSTIQTVISH